MKEIERNSQRSYKKFFKLTLKIDQKRRLLLLFYLLIGKSDLGIFADSKQLTKDDNVLKKMIFRWLLKMMSYKRRLKIIATTDDELKMMANRGRQLKMMATTNDELKIIINYR